MQSDDFDTLTARLRDLGGQRVWSLMVSLFGDLAQGGGDIIDGPVLTKIMDLLQVKPEATRVALHRLRNDGWITSQKSGRIRQHGLTDKGRDESVAASSRIYASPDRHDNDWHMAVIEHATPELEAHMSDIGFTILTPRVFIGPKNVQPPENALILTAQSVPDWMQHQLEPEGLRDDYSNLATALRSLKTALPGPNHITLLQTAVLRCLIVHNWRRLVLKHPPLPDALLAPDWPGRACHTLVADLLDVFPRPALCDINHRQTTA